MRRWEHRHEAHLVNGGRRPGVGRGLILLRVLCQHGEGGQRSGPRLGHRVGQEVVIKAGGGDVVVAPRLWPQAAGARVRVQSTLLLPPADLICLFDLAIIMTICGDQWRVFIEMFFYEELG